MKPKARIALIAQASTKLSQAASGRWSSADSVSISMRQWYRYNFRSQTRIFNSANGTAEFANTALKLKSYRPTHIVFSDWQPHPLELLVTLRLFGLDFSGVKIIFHTHGDFAFEARRWQTLVSSFSEANLCFVAPSEAHSAFCMKVIRQPVMVMPWPISLAQFRFRNRERIKLRERFGLTDDVKLFLYVGRVSPLKNVDRLVQTFERLKMPKSKLLIIGKFDGLFLRGRVKADTRRQSKQFNEFIRSFKANLRKTNGTFTKSQSVLWCDSVGPKELSRFYSAADCFVSLSTFWGETFGLTPREAGVSGLPLILSRWGGYRSLKPDEFVEVDSNQRRANIKAASLGSALQKIEVTKAAQRQHRGVEFLKSLQLKKYERSFLKFLNQKARPFKSGRLRSAKLKFSTLETFKHLHLAYRGDGET